MPDKTPEASQWTYMLKGKLSFHPVFRIVFEHGKRAFVAMKPVVTSYKVYLIGKGITG